jgi:aminoglycoside phosphotransferase (APT) family kinase protein
MDATGFQALLDALEPDAGGTVISCTPMPGGYSRTTVRCAVRWADGTTEEFMLRGDPPQEAGVFDSDRDSEWLLLCELVKSPTFDIPRPRWYDSTGEYLGTKCIVSDAVPSTSMQAFLETGPDLEKARTDFIDILVTVHGMSLDVLSDAISRPESWPAHIDRLMGVYDEILDEGVESNPVLRYIRRKMRANRPPEIPLTLVHGDYQPGNILFSATQTPVLIDWEFGHIGDPRQDLGYYFQIPMPPHLYHPDPETFLEMYRERTGLSREQVNPLVVEYFMLLGMIHLLRQMLIGTEDVTAGRHRGIMGTYLVIAITHFYNLFLTVSLKLPNVTERPQ